MVCLITAHQQLTIVIIMWSQNTERVSPKPGQHTEA